MKIKYSLLFHCDGSVELLLENYDDARIAGALSEPNSQLPVFLQVKKPSTIDAPRRPNFVAPECIRPSLARHRSATSRGNPLATNK